MTRALEDRVALPVTNDIRPCLADGQRRRRPGGAGFFVAQVDDFAGRIRDGIVRPGRQTILAAVDRPGVARACFSHLKAEVVTV